MTRILVFALVGAFSVAGSMGLAFGQSGHPQPHPTPKATKPHPPAAPGKRPPSKAPPQVKKSPSGTHRPVGPKGKSPRLTRKGSAKGGAGGYSVNDYKRDMGKAGKEILDGFKTALPGDLAVIGGAVAGSAGGPGGAALGAAGAAITNAPSLIQGGAQGLKGELDAASATARYAGSWLNGVFNSNRPTMNSKTGAQKSNQRPTKTR
jgi:hypothetical protein